MEGAQYRITGPNGYDETLTTNSEGIAQTETTLYLGTYTNPEVTAPSGFVLDSTSQEITIDEDSLVVNAVFTEPATQPNLPQIGVIKIQKSITSDEECDMTRV